MQIADAIVTGFAKSPLLVEFSFAPLRQLRSEGLLRHIHYVTWDDPDLDSFVAPIAAMSDVITTRIPQPAAEGVPAQRNLIYQIANLKAALGAISEPDTVVLKMRPDFVADVDFLREKVSGFAIDCEIDKKPTIFGVAMPKPVFSKKIWVPWADSNQPFFYEDAAFMGLRCDLEKMITPVTDADLRLAADPFCSHYVHIVRFSKIFTQVQPLFRGYLKNFDAITSDMDYRSKFIGEFSSDPFFWMLILAHAWILYSEFHVDCGEQGNILFYPSYANAHTDWAEPSTWRNTSPYEAVEGWRRGTHPGQMMRSVGRPFGRLMDDDWQDAIFSKSMPDFPRDTLVPMLEHIIHSGDGRLSDLESSFYRRLRAFKTSNAHLLSAKNGFSPGISSEPSKAALTPIVQGAAA